MTIPNEAQKGLQAHRRETRWMLWLPLWASTFLVVALAALLVVLQDGGTFARASVLAGIALSVLCLIPGILLGFVVFALLAVSIVGMNYLHRMTIPPLQRLEQAAYQARLRIDGWTQRANQSALRWGSFLAPLDQFFARMEDLLKEQQHDREQPR